MSRAIEVYKLIKLGKLTNDSARESPTDTNVSVSP